jgi:hypothetical protein
VVSAVRSVTAVTSIGFTDKILREGCFTQPSVPILPRPVLLMGLFWRGAALSAMRHGGLRRTSPSCPSY